LALHGAFTRAALTLASIARHANLAQRTLPLTRPEGYPIILSLPAARDEDLSLLAISRSAADAQSTRVRARAGHASE